MDDYKYSKSRDIILSRILQFGLTKKYNSSTAHAYGDYNIDCTRDPKVNDLVLISAHSHTKWNLAWLLYIEENGNRYNNRYLCRNIIDGEEIWWSNVEVRPINDKCVDDSWRWDNQQWKFNKRWIKEVRSMDEGYIYPALYCKFDEDGLGVTLSIRQKLNFSKNPYLPKSHFSNYKKIRVKDMQLIHDDLVKKYKENDERNK